ncbi:Crp/Fnr family transcriptional regulator [Flavobacterium hauense]
MQKLITYINSLVRFSPENWEVLKPVITRKTYAKGEFLLKPEEVCDSLFFIEQGYVRMFRVEDGAEVNTGLYFEGELVTGIPLFSDGKMFTIEACEPVTVLVLDKSGLLQMESIATQISVLWKNCLSFITAKVSEHSDLFDLYTPSERYEYIAKNKPQLLERVPPHILASYLGMGREKLNSIRKRRVDTRYTFSE